jgi:hypothetical protein
MGGGPTVQCVEEGLAADTGSEPVEASGVGRGGEGKGVWACGPLWVG